MLLVQPVWPKIGKWHIVLNIVMHQSKNERFYYTDTSYSTYCSTAMKKKPPTYITKQGVKGDVTCERCKKQWGLGKL